MTDKKKLWTNDPDLQDQETGETTERGWEKLRNIETSTDVKQQAQQKEPKMTKEATAKTETPPAKGFTKPPKFAKVSKSTPAAKVKEKTVKKPASKKAASNDGVRGRAAKYTEDMKVKVLVKENPKRGTAAERFNLYKSGMSIGEYFKAGGQRADINWDVKQGFISVK